MKNRVTKTGRIIESEKKREMKGAGSGKQFAARYGGGEDKLYS